MSCDICGRGACTRTFHSIAEQEAFDSESGANERAMLETIADLKIDCAAQRGAITALRAALAQERSDCAKLRAFAQDCEALWLNGGVDVLSLGDMLQRHKLISGPTGNPIVLLSGRGEGR